MTKLRTLALCCSLLGSLSLLRAQGVLTTVAGGDLVYPQTPTPATSVPLSGSNRMAIDSRGDIYLSMFFDLVLQISSDAKLRVVAGNYFTGFSGDGGQATGASLSRPHGIAVDGDGNLYIADRDNNRVRKVTPDGIIQTIAGTGELGSGGDGGPAVQAQFNDPYTLAVDGTGNLYIADAGNSRIRRVRPDGIIETVAGNGQRGYGGDNGPALLASFYDFGNLVTDAAGNLYVADTGNGRIRKITPDGLVTTVAGNGKEGFTGDNGPATGATLNHPSDVFVDAGGNIYIPDSQNNRVRKVTPDGIIRTIAGTGDYGSSGDNGPATAARTPYPDAIVVDAAGNIYFRESTNRIRKVAPNGIITTYAGNGLGPFAGDGGAATNALLGDIVSIALDAAGNLYIADPDNNRVRRVTPRGVISTIAGNGATEGYRDGLAATAAPLLRPTYVAADNTGNLYLTGDFGSRILRVAPNGIITTFAGTGEDGFSGDGRAATAATLNSPGAMAVDSAGNLYFADRGNQRVRRVARDGTISTVLASVSDPRSLALDASGALYVADATTASIRKIAGGAVSTVAQVRDLEAITVDPTGNLYISNSTYNIVQRLSPDGTLAPVAGDGRVGFSGDGGPALNSALRLPSGLAVNANGNLLFADSRSRRVRMLVLNFSGYQVSASNLSFSATADGPAPADQTVNLTSTPVGLAFTATADADWLRVNPGAGVMPANIQIGADPTGLAPGIYNGTVTINAPAINPPIRTIAVQFTVAAGTPPRLAVDSQDLTQNVSEGASPVKMWVNVINRGGGQLTFSASAETSTGDNWLAVSPDTGVATPGSPATVEVSFTPGSLAAGAYSGTVTIASAATNETVSIPVSLAISRPQSLILLSQTGLTFTTVAGGGAPLAQELDILNSGQGDAPWNAAAAVVSGVRNWLAVTPPSGSTQTPLQVSVDATGLQPGTYEGRIQVTAPADNSPQAVPVILNVLPVASTPAPEVQPTSLVFTGLAGTRPGSQTVSIANLGASALSYASSRTFLGTSWFDHTPASSALTPGQPSEIFVQPDFRGLTPGVQRGALTLVFADGSVRSVNVMAVVTPADPASPPGTPAPPRGCTADSLFIQFTSLSNGFTVVALQPAGLQVRVVDSCGRPVTEGSVVARFSNDDPAVRLTHTQNGAWSGTWQPGAGAGGAVQIAVTAFTLQNQTTTIGGQLILSGTLLPGR